MRGGEKDTIIAIMVGCMVLYAIFSISAFWVAALAVGLAGMTSSTLARWIHVAWFWIAEKLGYVMSRIVLGAVFLLVLLPIALMAKLFRGDFMLLKDKYQSCFFERPHVYEGKDLENPW